MSVRAPNPPSEGYRDRAHAGEVLAAHLTTRTFHEPVVFGLARGGVPVAAVAARHLAAPLRVAVARKITAPAQPELALGAVAPDGEPIVDRNLASAFGLNEQRLEPLIAEARHQAHAQTQRYQHAPDLELTDRDVILVDDGLATGATAHAAVVAAQAHHPRSVTLAAPVGAADAVARLARSADTVICPLQPTYFAAVGQWYRAFEATSDTEIHALIQESLTRENGEKS